VAKCGFIRYTRFAFRGSGCRGTRGSSEIALRAGSGKTLRDRNQGRSAIDADAVGHSLPRPASLPTKEVAQKDLTFVPALLPIEVGTKVQFPNLDDQYHNIFSYSPAKRFDLGRYRPEERPIPSVTFDNPGLVTLRCDIHEHMRGLILVLNTPYFVMTDTAGRFRLDKLPAGHYTLKAWIDSRTTREKSIDLKDGQTLHVDLP